MSSDCCGVQVQFGSNLSCVTVCGNGMKNVCSQGAGTMWTGVNSISAKKWRAVPEEVKIVN